MDPQTLKATILSELNLQDLSPQQQEEAVAAIGKPVIQSLTLDILEKLPEAEQGAFQAALTTGDAATMEKIITTNIPDPTAFIEQAIAKALAPFKSK